jgi:hypothetical protein
MAFGPTIRTSVREAARPASRSRAGRASEKSASCATASRARQTVGGFRLVNMLAE